MAIYEYYCSGCGKEFELRRPISESDAPALCPSCGAVGQKLVSVVASKVDYYVRAPDKPAFRQHPPAKGKGSRKEKAAH